MQKGSDTLHRICKIRAFCPKNVLKVIPDLQNIFSIEGTGVKTEKCWNLPFPKVPSVGSKITFITCLGQKARILQTLCKVSEPFCTYMTS